MENILYLNKQFFNRIDRKYSKSIFCINSFNFDFGISNSFEKVDFFTVGEVVSKVSLMKPSEAPDAIIFFTDYLDHIFYKGLSSISYVIDTTGLIIPLIVVASPTSHDQKIKILKHGADDCFPVGFDIEKLNYWIDFLKIYKKVLHEEYNDHLHDVKFKLSSSKRAFDIIISSMLLLILTPLFLVIALLVKLESAGPVYYVSKRAGAGYKIFNFIKFRTMAVGADKELSKLLHLNQYGNAIEVRNKTGANPIFFKIKDDPRITRFGKFLRNSSLDELPQLVNVLKGDMSIVGNRPLPLYEAKLLTKDQCAQRFMAAAGITGLWQVTKRGKGEMSEDERVALDIEYAKSNSFRGDLKLLLSTFPALFQERKV